MADSSKNPNRIIHRQLERLEERSTAADSKNQATKNRINTIRKQLEKLEEQPNYREKNKNINKIRTQVDKLEKVNPEEKKSINKIRIQLEIMENDNLSKLKPQPRRLTSGGPSLVYDKDSPNVQDRDPESAERLKKSASIAIDYFNKKHSIRYNVVDVISASRRMCSGYRLYLRFTAKVDGVEKVDTFNTSIFYGIGATEVQSIEIAAT
ncbi:hypothetical protein ACP275_06G171700 [Erythranthe tilingii]